MGTLNLVLVLLFSTAVQAKVPAVTLPKLPVKAADAAGFAPRGWRVQVQAVGDLNGDGRPDLAFVLQDTDARNVLKNGQDSVGVDEVNTNPRIFAVAFHDAVGEGYTLAMQNGTLIPRWTEPTQDDNFGDEGALTVKRGAVTVSLHYFSNAGGWDMGDKAFTFRWQHGRFELIGYENDNQSRNSGVGTKTSVNYSTGVVEVVTSNNEGPTGRRVKKVKAAGLLGVEAVGDGMAFEVR